MDSKNFTFLLFAFCGTIFIDIVIELYEKLYGKILLKVKKNRKTLLCLVINWMLSLVNYLRPYITMSFLSAVDFEIIIKLETNKYHTSNVLTWKSTKNQVIL